MTPDLIQIIDCLTPAQVEMVLANLNDDWWQPTTIFGDSGCEVNKEIRNNHRICLDDNSRAAQIMHDGMNEALLTYRNNMFDITTEFQKFPVPGSYRTNSYREAIQVLRYREEEFYSWHHDQASADVNEKNRTISVVLYLQNATDGGRTMFPHRAYRPKAGQALIFPSNWCFPHSAEPVKAGTKIAAVTWYHCHYNNA